MFWNTHLAAGLIIGKLTGHYDAALIGSFAADIDHLIPIIKNKLFLHPFLLLKSTLDESDTYRNERHILHNVLVWGGLSAVLSLIDARWGMIFALAYFIHLVFDALDGAKLYPFFPNKKINLKGPIGYASLSEFIFSIALFGLFFAL